MKTGKNLVELAQEIVRQAAAKKDFLGATADVVVTPSAQLDIGDGARDVTGVAHGQLAEFVDIPKAYYDRLRTEAPRLFAENVNTWLGKIARDESDKARQRRQFRTLDGKVRAILSPSYRALDNEGLAEVVLPTLQELGVEILSAEITERRLYIKAVDQRIVRDVPTGRKLGDGSHVFFDTLSPAITIGNSEVGAGSLFLNTSIYTRVCTNLATVEKSVTRRHIGSKLDGIDDGLHELLTDETKAASDRAIFLKVRDALRGAFEEKRFEALSGKLAATVDAKIEAPVEKLVEVTGRRFNLLQAERVSVLQHLIQGGDLSLYGVLNAVTRTAEDAASYDRATELEALGGKLIHLPAADWKSLNREAEHVRLAA